jgi:hypothetical protein
MTSKTEHPIQEAGCLEIIPASCLFFGLYLTAWHRMFFSFVWQDQDRLHTDGRIDSE